MGINKDKWTGSLKLFFYFDWYSTKIKVGFRFLRKELYLMFSPAYLSYLHIQFIYIV